MKEKSYSELMKSGTLNRKKAKESFVLDLYIEMLLSESLLKAEREKLTKRIDKAIDDQDKPTFMKLSKEYNQLTKRFGT
ncbi:IDEAL domain-containing protein [Cytobacillus sp. FJAT-54145]|uniref:IDEAL domain-containing protein n=1 Tax=Cytobacillus spartinae TaxID=3299023 RepID=A0ABW6K7U7_9BACI